LNDVSSNRKWAPSFVLLIQTIASVLVGRQLGEISHHRYDNGALKASRCNRDDAIRINAAQGSAITLVAYRSGSA
jgi:hypothetical protein